MAYWYDDTSARGLTSRRCVDFMMDSEEDLEALPTSSAEGEPQGDDSTLHLKVAKGSTAMSIETKILYILNSKDQWR